MRIALQLNLAWDWGFGDIPLSAPNTLTSILTSYADKKRMKKTISKNPIKRKREEMRIAKLEKEGRIVKGVKIPKDALPANPDNQDHGGGYAAKFYYKDIHYTCSGCGKKEVWTAQQQK